MILDELENEWAFAWRIAYRSHIDANERALKARVLRHCRHEWQPSAKRPRWLGCIFCCAVQDPSRGIRPRIRYPRALSYLVRHPSMAGSDRDRG